MNQKTYLALSATVFLIVGLFHVTRVIIGWEVSVAGLVIPQWASLAALIVAGILSYTGFRLAKR